MKIKDIIKRAVNYVGVFGKESNHFGVCPVCYTDDGFLNINRVHLFVCHDHKVFWDVGSNLFSCWREESEKDWERNAERLAGYKEIEGCHPGKKFIRFRDWLRSYRYKERIVDDINPF